MNIQSLTPTQPGKRWKSLISSILMAAAALCLPNPASAEGESLQARVRAAFLFNFARFTEWPTNAQDETLFQFCVVKSGAVAQALSDTLQNKTVLGLTPSIVSIESVQALDNCHLLYLPELPDSRLQTWLNAANQHNTLLVGEGRSFPQSPTGMVGFYLLDGRIRFAINPSNVTDAGLKMSSRLLGLADIVNDGES